MGDDLAERIAAAYDTISAGYAAANEAMPDDLVCGMARFLSLMGGRGPVLDIGCGAGRDMAWIERVSGLDVVGVDLSAGMLAQARRSARGPLLRMDMRRLACADAAFRGVWCCAALLHVPRSDITGALGEIRRVLAPEGALFLAVQEGSGEGWEEGAHYGPKVERYFARYSVEDLCGLLMGAGLRPEHVWFNQTGARRWINVLALAAHKAT
jgi:ubiquinone/menaquinone biosynthesis C-methylase UbiE